jgi:predicted HicB family RNase H-like nuclease
MPEKKVALNIRLPADLHEDLRQAAERDDRSLSNLIIHVLRTWRDEREAARTAERQGQRERR